MRHSLNVVHTISNAFKVSLTNSFSCSRKKWLVIAIITGNSGWIKVISTPAVQSQLVTIGFNLASGFEPKTTCYSYLICYSLFELW